MVGRTSRHRESPSTPPGNGSLINAIGVVATVFLSTAAHAQECVDIAQVLGREVERIVSLEQAESLRLETFCSSRITQASDSAAAQIQILNSAFYGKAGASRDEIERVQEDKCDGKFGNNRKKIHFSKEVNRVSQAGADVVKACLSSQSFRLVDLTIQGAAIKAEFRYGGVGEAVINGIIIQPKTIANCQVLYGGRTEEDPRRISGLRLKPNDSLALSCERKPDSATVDSTRLRFRGGILGVATTSATADIPLIEYQVPSVAEPVADELSRRIEQLTDDVAKLQAQMHENFPFIFYPANNRKCPNGYDNKGSSAIFVAKTTEPDYLMSSDNGGTDPYVIPGVGGGPWRITFPFICVQKK